MVAKRLKAFGSDWQRCQPTGLLKHSRHQGQAQGTIMVLEASQSKAKEQQQQSLNQEIGTLPAQHLNS